MNVLFNRKAKLFQKSFWGGVDSDGAGEVGIEGCWLGVHLGLLVVIDDEHMNALFDQEAKLNSMISNMLQCVLHQTLAASSATC